ncbi:origin recognition complex subunit 1, putative [Plasmodium gallinaceum]|uniref:Origin recognition complex subunit 1 n=1 Tax=Plasmodium gallinaceum TaxID=5849 RepID=A0A1J1GTW9_PLAGA|nr:origin recognition complex subunit 1, putative [Plasmodium gallinaceum]CRG95974.1 origin recognition complex subunit 1, putative [Plasmodium gallinaceum]
MMTKKYQNIQMNDNEILSPTKKGIKLDVSKLNILNFNNISKNEEKKKNENYIIDYNKIKNSTQEFYIEINQKDEITNNSAIIKKAKYNFDKSSSSASSSSTLYSYSSESNSLINDNNKTNKEKNKIKINSDNISENMKKKQKKQILHRYNLKKKKSEEETKKFSEKKINNISEIKHDKHNFNLLKCDTKNKNNDDKNIKILKNENDKELIKKNNSKLLMKRNNKYISKDGDTNENIKKKKRKEMHDTNINEENINSKQKGKNYIESNKNILNLIKSNTINLVKENYCEYEDGIIYESILINGVKYSINDNVMIYYSLNNSNDENVYTIKKGKISGFYKNLNSTNVEVEICLYYDKNDEIYIKELEKKQKSRRSKGDFIDFLDEKKRDFYLLGNVEFKILDAKLILKKIYVYNEKKLFEEDITLIKGKEKFLCTHYLKEREDKICEIQNEDHWDNLVLGSSDLYYYFSNNKKNNKSKSLKLIIEKLKINEEMDNGKKEGTNNNFHNLGKTSTTTNAKSKNVNYKANKSKTSTNKENVNLKNFEDFKDISFKNMLKQDQENYYVNLLSNIKDPTDKAIRMMQLDVVPKYLPCREKEIKEVHGFLESGIKQSGSNQILYISGMPGTGKTATVYSVIQLLQNKSKQKLLPQFNVFEINGMNVVHPNAAYQVFYKQLFNKKPPNALNSFKIIDRLFNKSQKDNRNVSVLIIDEIDYLITKTQKVLFTFFDWPTKVNSKLVLIAISNTMDLPDRLIPRCRSRLAFGRLVFSPYKGDEIEKIIKERLENCKEIIDHTAIQLCARKVANVSGDIRKALQICRKAFENKRGQKIVPRDITEATNQLFDSPLTNAINYLPWAFKIFLTCIIIELRILNEFIIPFKKVVNRYKTIIATSGRYIGMCSDHELFKIMLDKLVKMGILLIRPYIPLETLSNRKTKEALLGFNESSKKGEYRSGKTQVSADIDKESGDMGLEVNVETQLIVTALMKDPECSKKLNFY